MHIKPTTFPEITVVSHPAQILICQYSIAKTAIHVMSLGEKLLAAFSIITCQAM